MCKTWLLNNEADYFVDYFVDYSDTLVAERTRALSSTNKEE